MGIRFLKRYAALENVVSVEDAEALMQWLRVQKRPAVHLVRCSHMHAAVLQVLLVLQPKVLSMPANAWLQAALAKPPDLTVAT